MNGIDNFEYEQRMARRRQRIQEMKRKKRQQERMRKLFVPCAVALLAVIVSVSWGVAGFVKKHENKKRNIAENVQKENVETENPQDENPGKAVVKDTAAEETNTQKSKKGAVVYSKNVNVAGCYVGSAAAESIAYELEYADSLRTQTLGGKSEVAPLCATADERTTSLSSDVVSENGIFIDVAEERILAQKDSQVRISPASMTKILTVLVAAEHITDPDDLFEITIDITDYSYVHDCSNAGFGIGEKVTVKDLFYGTILPSGADAALGLATYVAGSQEAFVELMNEKIDELGLSETSHFTNCVGLYDDNHYSTVYDMSVMLKAAYDNSFCREVLAAHTYTTSCTEQHPEGIILSNWFLRRIEDKDTCGEVLCAKTGYVVQSGNCAASLSIGNDGKEYICVTAHSTSSWRCIYDHVALYQQFLSGQ